MKLYAITATAYAALAFANTQAQVASTTGAVVLIPNPPSDVSANHWENNTEIRAFSEQLAFVLPQNVSVDISVPGTSPSATSQNLSPGTITAGTLVNSYTLHFDIVGSRTANNALEAVGSVTFDQPIFGIMALSQTENDSNSLLGRPGVTYSSGADHGLELVPAGGGTSDSITFSSDLHTVSLDLHDASFADDIRIVTAVPEPAALTLIGFGSLLAAIWLRRRHT